MLFRAVRWSLARFAVGGAAVGVLLGGDGQVGGAAVLVVGVEFLKVGDAPPAPGAGAEAFGDQRSNRGILAFDERADLPEGYVEAQTHVVVGVHDVTLGFGEGVKQVKHAEGEGARGDHVGLGLEGVGGVGGASEPGDAIADEQVAGGVADASQAIVPELVRRDDAVDGGGLADVLEIDVDAGPGHGDAHGPAAFGDESLNAWNDLACQPRDIVVKDSGRSVLAQLQEAPARAEFGFNPAFEGADGSEVVGRDGGVHVPAVGQEVVDPHPVLARGQRAA